MATQGVVSVTENGKVILKAIAGCDGYNAKLLAEHIRKNQLRDIDAVYEAALELGFGNEPTLVVMDGRRIKWADGDEADDSLTLYRDTFSDPRFNPRWESGLVSDDCLAIVDLATKKTKLLGGLELSSAGGAE